MAKKNPLFSRTQIALTLGLAVFLLLCFIIRFLPERTRPESKAPIRTQIAIETVQATKEPETLPEPTEQATTGAAYSETRQPYQPTKTPREKPTSSSTSVTRPAPIESATTLARKNRKAIVVVIDDVGQNLQDLEPFLKLPVSLTFSVLPHLPHSREACKRIRVAGKEAILHMPMEANKKEENPGPGALYSADSNEQLVELLDQAFASVPGVRGFNNHMGSKITANIEAMRVILRYAAAKGFFFLDSRTTSATVAPEIAREYHVPFLERTDFLDNEPEAEAIQSQLTKVLELAVREASREMLPARPRIAIGHAQSHELATVLRGMLPLFKREGVEFARLDEFCNR